jgi:hypothetical protein
MKTATYFNRKLKAAKTPGARYAVLEELNDHGADVCSWDSMEPPLVGFAFEDDSELILPRTVFAEFHAGRRRAAIKIN